MLATLPASHVTDPQLIEPVVKMRNGLVATSRKARRTLARDLGVREGGVQAPQTRSLNGEPTSRAAPPLRAVPGSSWRASVPLQLNADRFCVAAAFGCGSASRSSRHDRDSRLGLRAVKAARRGPLHCQSGMPTPSRQERMGILIATFSALVIRDVVCGNAERHRN